MGVGATMTADKELLHEVASLLVEALNLETAPEAIDPQAPLYGDGLGLDSIDALEIVVMLESEFGIKVKNEASARVNFRSIAALADFVEQRISEQTPQV